ncbi:MAG: prephenate dehydrogenase [Lachnospiraceae bacterium]|nr:prephenate dehydrogenase [Lachnospiraceae bacterium]
MTEYDFSNIKCSFFGLGLIGGSVALALKNSLPDITIQAVDKDENSLSAALSEGIIAKGEAQLYPAFFDCDYLFLCAPVSENDALLEQIAEKIKEGCILTDVGSVKNTTCKAIEKAGLQKHFIGGHPMAGSEKTGFQNASAGLLENAYYILTPSPEVSDAAADRFAALIRCCGVIPLIMSPEKHDYVTGGISHLPHIISAALVNFVKTHDDDAGLMKQVAAGGFRDITRISSSSPQMWQAICMTNTDVIISMLTDYIRGLEEIKEKLTARDSEILYRFFDSAKEYRDSFQLADAGPIKKACALFVDIPDVPGSIAQTATILAEHDLSLKNIGIMNSREFQEGALRIEFYDEATALQAADVLRDHNYKIFVRE